MEKYDNNLKHPEYHAALAGYLEDCSDYTGAAEQWGYAAAASLGANRRAKYHDCMERCERQRQQQKAANGKF